MRRLLLLVPLLALVLSACGGAPAAVAPTAAPTAVPEVDPQTRVKNFFTDFAAAFSDPNIAEEATMTEWADKLSEYATPDEREEFRSQVGEMLESIAAVDFGALAAMSGNGNTNANSNEPLDVRMSLEFLDIQTELVSSTATTATVRLTDGMVKVGLVGDDVAQLGEMAQTMNQEVSIGEFLGTGAGSENEPIELEKIDGIWYFKGLLSQQG